MTAPIADPAQPVADPNPAPAAPEPVAAPAAPGAIPQPGPTPPAAVDKPETGDGTDWKAEHDKAQADLAKWREMARKNEDRAKGNASAAQQAEQFRQLAADFAKAVGIQTDDSAGTPTPEQLLVQAQEAAEHNQAMAWRQGVENHVLRMAGRLGANADALLDSMSFIGSLDDLAEANPTDQDFATHLEAKVRDAMAKNPAFKVAPPVVPPAARSGADLPGGPTPPRQRPAGLHAAVAGHYQQHG
jgi:hypothetical protein